MISGKKKRTKINWETAGWAVVPRKGVVVEKFVPSKVCLPWVSKGGAWDVPGILPDVPDPWAFKNLVLQKFVPIARPL